jgi:hypothetical protein
MHGVRGYFHHSRDHSRGQGRGTTRAHRLLAALLLGILVMGGSGSVGAAMAPPAGGQGGGSGAAPLGDGIGQALTVLELASVTLDRLPAQGALSADAGRLVAESRTAGELLSRVMADGLRVGADESAAWSRSAGGDDAAAQEGGKQFDLPSASMTPMRGKMALHDYSVDAKALTGAHARLGLLSATLSSPRYGVRTDLGERGLSTGVDGDAGHARAAYTVRGIRVDLGAVLPFDGAAPLPLGVALDLARVLDIPLGPQAGDAAARLRRLAERFTDLEGATGDWELAITARGEIVGGEFGVSDAAVQSAQLDVTAAQATRDAAVAAAAAAAGAVPGATAARDAATGVLAAAQADLDAATAAATAIATQLATVEAEINALEAEKATANPLRLAEILLEIAALTLQADGLEDDLTTAQAVQAGAQGVKDAAAADLAAAQTDLDAASAADAAAAAALVLAEAALTDAGAALVAATDAYDAAVAAAAQADAVRQALLDAADARLADAQGHLEALLAEIDGLLTDLEGMAQFYRELLGELHVTPLFALGGLDVLLESQVGGDGPRTDSHCRLSDVVVAGQTMPWATCEEFAAGRDQALARIAEVFDVLGVDVRPLLVLETPDLTTAQGTTPDGWMFADARLRGLRLRLPSVRLGSYTDPLRAQIAHGQTVLAHRAFAGSGPGAGPGVGGGVVEIASAGGGKAPGAGTVQDGLDELSQDAGEMPGPDAVDGQDTVGFDAQAGDGGATVRYQTTSAMGAGADSPLPAHGKFGDKVRTPRTPRGTRPAPAAPAAPAAETRGGDAVGSSPAGPPAPAAAAAPAEDASGGGGVTPGVTELAAPASSHQATPRTGAGWSPRAYQSPASAPAALMNPPSPWHRAMPGLLAFLLVMGLGAAARRLFRGQRD